MIKEILICSILFLFASFGTKAQSDFNTLVWSDEFNQFGPIDTSKWHHQTQLPDGNSWFNGEIQHYTDRILNSYQGNGELHIVAKKEQFSNQGVSKDYTSARLNSKFAFTYGRVEIRAKLPVAFGTWPAIWMLGKNIDEIGGFWQKDFGSLGWPACGEIDIMEHWGSNLGYVSSAVHTPSSYGNTINKGGISLSNVKSQYHIYSLDWYEDRLIFGVDSQEIYTYQPPVRDEYNWPFDKDQYILLNIAIEAQISSSFTEEDMIIDYVRVYQDKDLAEVNQIHEFTEGHFQVSPNPFKDFIEIQSTGSHSSVVYNTRGMKVLESIDNLIDTSELPKGIYFISVDTENGQDWKKIIKQ